MILKEIVLSVDIKDKETAEAIASMSSEGGIYTEDYSDLIEGSWEIAHIDIIDEELLGRDRSTVKIHVYLTEDEPFEETMAFLNERLSACNIKFECSASDVSDDEWKDNWKKYFKCTEIGNRLTVKPSWENYENKNGRCVLEIDPGAAFGTGTHATTLMCLDFLDGEVKGGEKVLDIGCGSGILAMAAVKLGAAFSDGVDIDSVAVKVAKDNAELNGISDKTEFICGDLAEEINGKYDIVCANIVADVIIRLCENITDYMKENSVAVFSGIIVSRAEEVIKAIESTGLTAITVLEKNGWNAVIARRNV